MKLRQEISAVCFQSSHCSMRKICARAVLLVKLRVSLLKFDHLSSLRSFLWHFHTRHKVPSSPSSFYNLNMSPMVMEFFRTGQIGVGSELLANRVFLNLCFSLFRCLLDSLQRSTSILIIAQCVNYLRQRRFCEIKCSRSDTWSYPDVPAISGLTLPYFSYHSLLPRLI